MALGSCTCSATAHGTLAVLNCEPVDMALPYEVTPRIVSGSIPQQSREENPKGNGNDGTMDCWNNEIIHAAVSLALPVKCRADCVI